MTYVFADTFYFIALLNEQDEAHQRAAAVALANDLHIFTTTWVLTELADGLASTHGRDVFAALVADLQAEPRVTIIQNEPSIWDAAVRLYDQRRDKHWSLTDCTSFEVMRRQQITDALTGDHHFEQAGFRAILK